MSNNIKLYRKRFIPNETTYLKDDEILFIDNDLIITQWNTLKPRSDISRGISAYFMKDGYKISKIYDSNNKLVYWYCDIIRWQKDCGNHSIIFEDLLLDVVVYENGFIKVLDTGEVAEALEMQYIDVPTAITAMHTLDRLLQIIYRGDFHILQQYINEAEHNFILPVSP